MARIIQITNNEASYTLDESWSFDLSELKRRLSLSDRYSKNGSNASGDRKSPARSMNFKKTFKGTSDSEYIDYLNELDIFLEETKSPFYLEDLTNSRRAQIEIDKISSTPTSDGNRYRVENIMLGVVMLDAEWQDLEETITDFGTMANDDTDNISNTGKETFPIVEITSNTIISEFEFRNETNSTGFSMSLSDFDSGETIIINSLTGSITKNDVDISSSIVDGGVPKISNGSNTFRYNSSSGSSDIQVKWRKVYSF